MLKKWRKEKVKKKSLKWGGVFLAFIMSFGATVGFLGYRIARAYTGDYWTVTNEDNLSVTVVSVMQDEMELVPLEDGDEYYFATANSAETVRIGLRVDGMKPGETYYYYRDNGSNGRVNLTSEDNGQVIYEERKPHVYFQDEDNCHGGCYPDPFAGEYYVGADINIEGGIGVQKNLRIRPSSIGSESIDILSVKQNNVDLALVNNEYQLGDYTTPVMVTYKLKDLLVGSIYSIDVGHSYSRSFQAETTEFSETRELVLDLTSRHTDSSISLYGYNKDEYVSIYFKVTDEDFHSLGDIVISDIEQGGEPLQYVEDKSSEWRREYTFDVNDTQGLTVRMHTTLATADMNYYIRYSTYGSGGGYLSSEEPIVATGEQLEQESIVFNIPALYGMSDYSPLTLSFSVSTLESGMTSSSSGSRRTVFKNYGEFYASDAFLLNIFKDENAPRYDAMMYYSDGTEIDGNRISPARHDEEHPLLIQVQGEHYNDEQSYDVIAKVKLERETYYSHTFSATGAELNEGTVFELSGLTLSLPEFDPNDNSSVSEIFYEFSLEIDGLSQSGDMFYAYDGWVDTLLTYDGGEIAAMGAGGGMGGTIYITNNGLTMRKSSLDGSKNAVLHYLGRGFDDDATYDYTLYYNDNVTEEWWDSTVGTVIEQGTITGAELNQNEYSVDIAMPSNESTGVMYSLVITLNGGIVKVVHDSLFFTEEPKIESFKFSADSDSFMQTDWTSYRVAKDTDITATLAGSGFGDEEEYKFWVSYSGFRFSEEDEYGYVYTERVDLSDLDDSAVVTGAQLNAEYEYVLEYDEAFDGVDYVEIDFLVSDKDAPKPDSSGSMGYGSYAGHYIHVDYVNDDEVFRDNGYQINDNSEIIDVSQPDEHGGIPIDDRSGSSAEAHIEGNTLTLVAEKPCVVIGSLNDVLSRIEIETTIDDDGVKTNTYNVEGFDSVIIAVKGDVTFDGTISSADSNFINRSLISDSLPAYRSLSNLERMAADVSGDGNVTSADSNFINRSLISDSLPAYKAIEW